MHTHIPLQFNQLRAQIAWCRAEEYEYRAWDMNVLADMAAAKRKALEGELARREAALAAELKGVQR